MEVDSHALLLTGLLSFVLLCLGVTHFKPDLRSIPTVRNYGHLSSYIGALRYVMHARSIIQEGYAQFGPSKGLFKIPLLNSWQVVITTPEHINDIRRAKDDELSLVEAQNDALGLEYTVGWERGNLGDYHVKVLLKMLTSNFAPNCQELHDEAVLSLSLALPLRGDEWMSILPYPSALTIIARVSNRLYVGHPLCQDPEYIKLVLDHSQGVPPAGMLINLFPPWLQGFIGPVISPLSRNTRRANKVFGSYLAERIRLFKENGKEWEDKPNDLVTWLLEEAEEHQREASNIAMRLLRINFAGLMSTSLTLSHVLFHLAARFSEYAPVLRAEVEEMVAKEGWTKGSVSKMFKLDSFLRESTRLSGFSALTLHRKVMNPAGFTFSDGVTVPYGCYLSAPSYTVHRLAENFENPDVFDGLRFYKLRTDGEEQVGEDDVVKHQLTTPATSNLVFGIGKHVCPGRFFMTHILKTILGHILLNYDMQLEEGAEGMKPKDVWLGSNCLPNSKAKVMFRNRSEDRS